MNLLLAFLKYFGGAEGNRLSFAPRLPSFKTYWQAVYNRVKNYSKGFH